MLLNLHIRRSFNFASLVAATAPLSMAPSLFDIVLSRDISTSGRFAGPSSWQANFGHVVVVFRNVKKQSNYIQTKGVTHTMHQ